VQLLGEIAMSHQVRKESQFDKENACIENDLDEERAGELPRGQATRPVECGCCRPEIT